MYPSLYQINIRVFRHRFGDNIRLLDIPSSYWQGLAETGIDYVWLMGVWQTGANAQAYAMVPELQAAYTEALPDWQAVDVIGSPYAVDRYVLHQDLGTPEDLRTLKEHLNALGIKLILDFVPNHFFAETTWLTQYPEVFLEVDPGFAQHDLHTFYSPGHLPGRYFAHGKDPHFPAWQDTIQVNYAHPSARFFMQEQLLQLADLCDGVRCDMAMLPRPEVFRRTWGYALGEKGELLQDFWRPTIGAIHKQYPDFLFIAEVYWDMEWELQQQGFDYAYDKRLRDRVIHESAGSIRDHLHADLSFQNKLVRFLENHDEDRVLAQLNITKAKAAAMITYTLPGLRFFHQGQWEGRQVRLPVQLGREPVETQQDEPHKPPQSSLKQLPGFATTSNETTAFYEYLLQLLQQPILRSGNWQLLAAQSEGGHIHPSVLAWRWTFDKQELYIAVNYSENTTTCFLPIGNSSNSLSLSPYECWVRES